MRPLTVVTIPDVVDEFADERERIRLRVSCRKTDEFQSGARAGASPFQPDVAPLAVELAMGETEGSKTSNLLLEIE